MMEKRYLDEDDLVSGLITQNQHAINHFVNKYQESVFRICMGFIHKREDAEEATQDVLIEAIRKIKTFRKDSKLSTWLYRICYTRSMNKLKQKNWRKWIDCFDDIIGFKEEKYSEGKNEESEDEYAKTLHEAIDRLPEKQRIAFVLCKYEELSYQEIAETMKTSLSAVESLIFRAKQTLMRNLKEKKDERK